MIPNFAGGRECICEISRGGLRLTQRGEKPVKAAAEAGGMRPRQGTPGAPRNGKGREGDPQNL